MCMWVCVDVFGQATNDSDDVISIWVPSLLSRWAWLDWTRTRSAWSSSCRWIAARRTARSVNHTETSASRQNYTQTCASRQNYTKTRGASRQITDKLRSTQIITAISRTHAIKTLPSNIAVRKKYSRDGFFPSPFSADKNNSGHFRVQDV